MIAAHGPQVMVLVEILDNSIILKDGRQWEYHREQQAQMASLEIRQDELPTATAKVRT